MKSIENLESYGKEIQLNLKTSFDKQSLKEVTKEFNSLNAEFKNIEFFDKDKITDLKEASKIKFEQFEINKAGIFNEEELAKFSDEYINQQEILLKISKLKKMIAEIKMFDEDNDKLKLLKKELSKLNKSVDAKKDHSFRKEASDIFEGFKDAYTEWKKEITDTSDAGKNLFLTTKKVITDTFDNIKNYLYSFVKEAFNTFEELAKWDLDNSNIYNKSAVDMYMQTGLSGKEAYGFNKALEVQGFSDMDDFLENLSFMNEKQLDYMKEVARIESENYDNAIETSILFQDFKKEYDIFKKDIQKELISFFMENKDAIMMLLKAAINALDGILKVVNSIFAIFSGPKERTDIEKKQAAADILGISSTTLNTNKTNNIKVNNTFNGINQQDQQAVVNAVNPTYRPIIEALSL